MSRIVAVVWHGAFSLLAGVLFFFFVLPRWTELAGDTSPTLGTVLRIATGVLIGLAALPVVFTWLRTRRPEYGTPQLALTLRVLSIVLHVLGGVLIVGAAVSEIWLSLDDFGQWIFGIYGAAAAISLLAIAAFDLAFVAELPPPPPRPMKAKTKTTKRRGRKKAKAEKAAEAEVEPTETAEASDEEKPAEATVEESPTAAEDEPTSAEETAEETIDEATADAAGAAESQAEPAADPADAEDTATDAADSDESAEEASPTTEDESTDAGETDDNVSETTDEATDAESDGDRTSTAEDGNAVESGRGGLLRNRRPAGKAGGSRWRRKPHGGVVVED